MLAFGFALAVGCGSPPAPTDPSGITAGGAPSAPSPSSASSGSPSADSASAAQGSPAAGGSSARVSGPAGKEPKDLLSSCTERDGLCLPDPGLVARICDGQFPDAALVMFSGKSLFSRVYLKGTTEGWNADSGKSARAKLLFQEEVLVLKRRAAPKNGIVVGAGGGYLVMRWDGNCYTLDDGEVSTGKPSKLVHAPLQWNLLEPPTKDALLKSPVVLAAFQKRGKECKGVTSGIVSKSCESADAALTSAVVEEIRKGLALPLPSKLP